MNVQVIADAAGRLIWASPALSGSIHDLTATRTHGIIDALVSANVMALADKTSDGRSCQTATFDRHWEGRRFSVVLPCS